MIDFGVTRSKVRVTQSQNEVWIPGGGIIFYPFVQVVFLVYLQLHILHNFLLLNLLKALNGP